MTLANESAKNVFIPQEKIWVENEGLEKMNHELFQIAHYLSSYLNPIIYVNWHPHQHIKAT